MKVVQPIADLYFGRKYKASIIEIETNTSFKTVIKKANLDHILWNRGYEAGIYEKPAHRTFSVWY